MYSQIPIKQPGNLTTFSIMLSNNANFFQYTLVTFYFRILFVVACFQNHVTATRDLIRQPKGGQIIIVLVTAF